MPDDTTDPILPIPSDLDQQAWDIKDAVTDVRRRVQDLQNHYRDLSQAPESLRTDDLGRPITAAEATNLTLTWLESADRALAAAEDGIRRTHAYTSRLSLTDQAFEERQQHLTPPTPPTRRWVERTR